MNYIISKPKHIGVYVQTSNCKTISAVKSLIDADVICNFQMFDMTTREASFVLKVDGKVLGNDGENYYGYAWNKNDTSLTFTTASNMGKYDNFAGCICVVKDGKAIDKPSYPAAIGGKRGRTCVGLKADGSIVIYCWKDGSTGACTMEQLGQKMVALGCVNAVNYDGGGSTQLLCPDGGVTTSRTIYNFLYFQLDSEKKTEDSQVEADECPYKEPTANIRLGSVGEGAKWVQWYLAKNKLSVTVDGIFGLKSVSALKTFQKSAGLTVDGICGPATRVALRVGITEQSSVVIKDECPYKEPTVNIKSGSTGDGVKWLQWYLNKHGADLEVDGKFGAGTQNALINFQKAAGLTADGICGAKTREALKSESVSVSSDEYVKTLKDKREKMLDIIESRVGDIYLYGAQSKTATESLIDWSARCFPSYTTSTRAARMKQYIKDHPKNAAGKPIGASDCSGLFFVAENEVELPLVDGKDIDDATAAGLYSTYCYPITKSELQPLDLVFNSDLTHVGIVVRGNRIVEQSGSDIGCVINDSVDDRIVDSIYGPAYGLSKQYKKSDWAKYGRLCIYKNIPY